MNYFILKSISSPTRQNLHNHCGYVAEINNNTKPVRNSMELVTELIQVFGITKGSVTQKAGCRGGQAVAGNRSRLRSGDARLGAAAKSGPV